MATPVFWFQDVACQRAEVKQSAQYESPNENQTKKKKKN